MAHHERQGPLELVPGHFLSSISFGRAKEMDPRARPERACEFRKCIIKPEGILCGQDKILANEVGIVKTITTSPCPLLEGEGKMKMAPDGAIFIQHNTILGVFVSACGDANVAYGRRDTS